MLRRTNSQRLLLLNSLDVQEFYEIIKKAAKKTILRPYRNNYIPCWDVECESLYKIFLQSPQGNDLSLAATALLTLFDRKREIDGLKQLGPSIPCLKA